MRYAYEAACRGPPYHSDKFVINYLDRPFYDPYGTGDTALEESGIENESGRDEAGLSLSRIRILAGRSSRLNRACFSSATRVRITWNYATLLRPDIYQILPRFHYHERDY